MLFLCTYNILFGHDQKIFNTLKIIKNISSSFDNSIIALQEVRQADNRLHILKKIKNVFQNFNVESYISPNLTLHDLGLATFSTLKAISCAKLEFPKPGKKLVNPQFYFTGVVSLHGCLIITYKYKNKLLRVTNLHLHVVGTTKHKLVEINAVLNYLDLYPVNYDIICGDFNTMGPIRVLNKRIERQKDLILKKLGKDFKEAIVTDWTSDNASVMSPLMPAAKHLYKIMKFFNIRYRQKLDWVFVKGLIIHKAYVNHDLQGSDHYPLCVELDIE